MTYVTNKLRKLLNDGKVALGVTVQLGSPENVEIAGHLGYDWVWIDAEHGTMDLNMIANLVRAARATGISSVVRVPDQTPSFITRVLDAGADGIIVPHVKSKAIAEAVVAAAKFGPDGSRGGCPSTGATGHSVFNWNEFWPAANRDTHVWGLIEDLEGVENIEEIVTVSGLDAVLFGPFDLAQSLGYGGDVWRPEILEHQRHVQEVAKQHGVEVVSLLNWEPGGKQGAMDRGAHILAASSDRGALVEGWKTVLAEYR